MNTIRQIETGKVMITIAGSKLFGKLKTKAVIHAVGPDYRSYGDYDTYDKQLYNAYYNSLKEAETHKYTSIGFCLLSSGIFNGINSPNDRYPNPKKDSKYIRSPKIIRLQAIRAFVKYINRYKDTNIKEINLVIFGQENDTNKLHYNKEYNDLFQLKTALSDERNMLNIKKE